MNMRSTKAAIIQATGFWKHHQENYQNSHLLSKEGIEIGKESTGKIQRKKLTQTL